MTRTITMMLCILTVAAAAPAGPYAADPEHVWNRLHRALFVRTMADGSTRDHPIDPLLYRGGTFLLEGEEHARAIAALDAFLKHEPAQGEEDALKRFVLQRDLWAAF